MAGNYTFRVGHNPAVQATNSLVTYPAVAGHTSTRYTVTLSQGGEAAVNSPVLVDTKTIVLEPLSETNHWTQFSFTGSPVTVTVTNLLANVASATIRPLRKGLSCRVSSVTDTVTFAINEPGQYWVDTGDFDHPIFIFADPIETNVPVVNGTTVKAYSSGVSLSGVTALVFEPGVHTLDPSYAGTVNKYDVTYGVEMYIKGGAWVSGSILVATGSGAFKLRGRGTLSGDIYDAHAETASLRTLECAADADGTVEVEGVTFAACPSHAFVTNDNGHTETYTKYFGFHHTTDGTRLGTGATLSKSFFKCNDDAVKLYGSNITVTDIVAWMQPTGSIFQCSWNQSSNNTNNSVSRVDVIHCDRTAGTFTQTINNGVVGCRKIAGGATFTNFTFDDVRVEKQAYQVWSLWLSWDGASAGGAGAISDFTFSNWRIAATSLEPEYFTSNGAGAPGTITDLNFVNCKVGAAGTPLTSANFQDEGGADITTFTFS